MGKISDALKKVMAEREQEKQGRCPQVETKTAASRVPVKDKMMSFSWPSADAGIHPSSSKLKDNPPESKDNNFYLAKSYGVSGIDPRVVTYFDHSSPVAEQYRNLRTHIKSYLLKGVKSAKIGHLKALVSPTKLIVVTSSLHSEGKTVTSVNLAVSLAKDSNAKVLIVDCDLRNGTVHKLLNLDASPGLSEVLTGDYDYSVALRPTNLKNLFVIPRGRPSENPAELLGSKKMCLILEQLRAEPLSYVIIDTPPIIPFADASVICSQADAVALVVQAYRTQAQVVKRAKELVQQAHGNLLGFVLTQTDYYTPELYSYKYYYGYRNDREGAAKNSMKDSAVNH